MIIKSMSRKAPTFGQLADYIARGSDAQTGTAFVRNLYATGQDRAAVVGQFLDNYRYLPERKGGNALYHEVVVLEPQPHLSHDDIEAALHSLAERYCEERAPHQLVWGRVHLPSSSEAVGQSKSTDFPHIHLMISANAVRSDRRVRMEKSYFAQVQRDLERWRAENFPQLRARAIYAPAQEQQTPRQPKQEGEMVRRTGKPSDKQQVFSELKAIFEGASDRTALSAALRANGFELYTRGQSWGVIQGNTGRRYRLRTLGLQPVFDRLPERSPTQSQERHEDRRAAALLQSRMAQRAGDVIDRFDRDDR